MKGYMESGEFSRGKESIRAFRQPNGSLAAAFLPLATEAGAEAWNPGNARRDALLLGQRRIRQAVLRSLADGDLLPVFVVDQTTNLAIYDAYRERYGKDPQLLPRGEFIQVVNAEVYQSWNPFWVIVLTPVVVWFFGWRLKIGKQVPTAHKLLYGMLLTTAALDLACFPKKPFCSFLLMISFRPSHTTDNLN